MMESRSLRSQLIEMRKAGQRKTKEEAKIKKKNGRDLIELIIIMNAPNVARVKKNSPRI